MIIVAIITAGVIGFFVHEGKPPFDKQPPRSVAASTTTAQDAVLTDVSRAVGGRWSPIEATLGKCEDDEQYKGWSRRAAIRTDRGEDGEDLSGLPPATSPAMIEAIRAALAANGYETDDRIPVEEYTEFQGRPEGSPFGEGDSVAIVLSEKSATIRVNGDCEVPGR